MRNRNMAGARIGAMPNLAAGQGLRGGVAMALSVLSALALMLVMALPAKAASREEVQEFLKVTGFDVALESIKFSAESGPQMLGLQDSDFDTSWSILTKDVFDVGKMQDMGVEMLENTMDEEDLQAANAFYGSDLGQRLVEAENTAHLDNGDDKGARAQAELERMLNDGDNERIEVLDRLNRAVDVSDSSDNAMVGIQYRFLMAARDAGIIEFRVDDQTLRESLERQAKEVKDLNRAASLASAAYTYRDFSQDELEQYAEALEDPAMQRVYELMNAVQFEIMANRFEVVAGRLKGIQPSTDL